MEGIRTLFIRNLPYTATNEQLETICSEFGPIKSCFVVKDRDTGKCRGFGYVKYSTKEDAETAVQKLSLKKIDGRKLFVHPADKKPKQKKKGKLRKETTLDDDGSSDTEDDTKTSNECIETANVKIKKEKMDTDEEDDTAEDTKPPEISKVTIKTEPGEKPQVKVKPKVKDIHLKEKHRAACTLVVKNFDPEHYKSDVTTQLQEQKKLRKVIYPVPDRPNNVAHLLFKSKRDALKAGRKLDKKKVKGNQLSAVLLPVEQAREREAKQPKRCRLIIRNLSFKVTDDKLEEVFSKYGEVTEVNIPKKPDGKMLGFGFVQFTTMQQANKALSEMNAKPILNRPVAVDWAVSKNKFEEMSKKTESSDSGSYSSSGDEEDEDDKEDSDSDASDTTADEEEEPSSEEELDSPKKQSGGQSQSDDSESEDESPRDEESEDSAIDEDTSESDDDESEEGDETSSKLRKPQRKSDVDEGATIFIRNLSYDTEDIDLGEFFEQYGEIAYARVVMNPDTEHSKGTGFVKFKKKDAAEMALAAAENTEEPMVLDGRTLILAQAITRENAVKMEADKKKKEEKDSRNLYLAREGMIRPGTQDAQGLSSADLNKRSKLETVKRQKLKNPNIFISDTRLSVHNIPVSVDEKKLKQVFLKAAEDKTAKITECRIMKDLARVNSKGQAKSRGYGFINFSQHKHALVALRGTNNNPDTFGDKRRLIVEFSLENRVALAAKEKRFQRAKAKQETLQKGKSTFSEVKTKKSPHDRRKASNSRQTKSSESSESSEKPTKKEPKGLPTHWGPKVRHKKRGGDGAKSKKAEKKKSWQDGKQEKRKREPRPKSEKPTKRRRREVHDSVDHLINKYSSRIKDAYTKGQAQAGNKSKWFDS